MALPTADQEGLESCQICKARVGLFIDIRQFVANSAFFALAGAAAGPMRANVESTGDLYQSSRVGFIVGFKSPWHEYCSSLMSFAGLEIFRRIF